MNWLFIAPNFGGRGNALEVEDVTKLDFEPRGKPKDGEFSILRHLKPS